MALLPNDPTVQGKALFEGTQAPYTSDDAGDKKSGGGAYTHNAKEGSATNNQAIVDWLLYINSILVGWTLTGIADGYVMRWVTATSRWVAGKLSLSSLANIAANTILGNPTGSPAVPSEISCTAAGRAILDDADAAAQRATMGAAASGLATASGLTVSATNKGLGRVSSGAGAVEEFDLTAAGRALLDDADAAAQRDTLGFDAAATSIIRVPKWVKITKDHTAFQTAALTNTIELFSLPAGGIIHAVKIKHSVAFAGTLISAYTLEVGISGTTNKYANAFDVFQAVSGTAFELGTVIGSEDHGAATSIKVTATSVGANLDQSTAGSADIWVLASIAV